MKIVVSSVGVLIAVTAAFFVLLVATLLDWYRDRKRPRWVNRLDIDESGCTYTAVEPYSEGGRWADVDRVWFYHGEPDFPDPIGGMAAIAEWQFVYLPDHRSAHVPHSARDTPRLAAACEKHLPGFDLATLQDVSRLGREGRWLLWDRGEAGRVPNGAVGPQPSP